nr:helix-turn-helix domain-containing protein [Streptomyces sp. SID13031]
MHVITSDFGAAAAYEAGKHVERIAAATGFGSSANFRTHFRREVGTTPTAYRRSS